MTTRKSRQPSTKLVFGKVLREFRRSRKVTQEALALSAGLDRAYVSILELGRRSPTLDTMYAIACALGVSLTDMTAAVEAAMAATADVANSEQ